MRVVREPLDYAEIASFDELAIRHNRRPPAKCGDLTPDMGVDSPTLNTGRPAQARDSGANERELERVLAARRL